MHLHYIFIKPNKKDFLNVTNKNISLDQILSSEKLHQNSYENFHAHHALHTSKHNNLVKNKSSSPYSHSAQYWLDSFYFHGRIRKYDSLKHYFIFYSACNPNPRSLSHEKPFPLTILIFMYFITNHLHYQQKTTHFTTPLFLNQSLQQYFLFKTNFPPLNKFFFLKTLLSLKTLKV